MYIVHECVPVSSHSNEAQVWEYVASRSRARVCVCACTCVIVEMSVGMCFYIRLHVWLLNCLWCASETFRKGHVQRNQSISAVTCRCILNLGAAWHDPFPLRVNP